MNLANAMKFQGHAAYALTGGPIPRMRRKDWKYFEAFRQAGWFMIRPVRHGGTSVRRYAERIGSFTPDTGLEVQVLREESQSVTRQTRTEGDAGLLPNLGSQP